jgi:DNA-directed RNA polymerase subunit beta'
MKDLLNFFDKPKDPISVEGISIKMAAPDIIREWSYGEVKKPETINYRTFKPERDGLFCAKIFGPIKDYECICGKYKRMKHRGVVCEKCGVEVTLSRVRRERCGHIELAAPVAHIWFLRSLPSRIGALLDLSLKDLERILYNEAYIVKESASEEHEGGLKIGTILSEQKCFELKEAGVEFQVGMGGEVIKEMLSRIDIDLHYKEVRNALKDVKTELAKAKLVKRLKVIESLRKSDNRPEWFMMDVIPVLPPDLRPLVPLEAGRFATSDLNDLYRRVINRNNRLQRLKELNAPEIIIRNEKRMLQESVDALFDNGRRGKVFTGANKRPLRSLSDMLKGKQGRFRQNLLGKRVDYSGRSVIVVGPTLRLHQCGLPKAMALELFKPFIYNKLIEKGHCTTIKVAKRLVEQQKQAVWDILEDVVQEHPVLLNRAPTLHRLGIQAFEPVLIEGKAIRLHPLVCSAFNADFDGDQMAVHVPLSIEAQIETRILAMSTNNILSPKDGQPIIVPSQDIVLGMYYMSRIRPFSRGYDSVFASKEEAQFAYHTNNLHLQAPIKVRINGDMKETTVGRTFVFDILPKCLEYDDINLILNKKALAKLIDKAYRKGTEKDTVLFADAIMRMGYEYATKAGISINVKDMEIPKEKQAILDESQGEVDQITNEYNDGAITNGERYNKIVDVWAQTNEKISKVMIDNLSTQKFQSEDGTKEMLAPSFNAIFMMADSGARGSQAQIRQLAGMRGLMAKPSGEIIETPITSNFREGLSVLQYFASSHGARKGLADTALKTANSGYLTRRLVDVAQDGIIRIHDCGSTDGIVLTSRIESGEIVEHIGKRVLGRVAAEEVIGKENSTIFKVGHLFTEKDISTIEDEDIDQIKVRSVITCEVKHGFCSMCFGRDLARGHLVSMGEAVGVIAAQSIGEPGTQLTMRTFHVGGTATAGAQVNKSEAKTAGLISLDNVKTVPREDGTYIIMNKTGEVVIKTETGAEKERYPAIYGATLFAVNGDKVSVGEKILEWDPFAMPVLSEVSGSVKLLDFIVGTNVNEQVDPVTGLTHKVTTESKDPAKQARVALCDANGEPVVIEGTKRTAIYRVPVGAVVTVSNNDVLKAGDVIAKVQRETTKTKDITGGLPRVAELFEARKPSNSSQIADVHGTIEFGPEVRGSRKIIVNPEDPNLEPYVYSIPKSRYVVVNEGDYVRPGDQLSDGSVNPHDILRVLGIKSLSRYIVDEIQEVYRLQGVDIDDKHIEVIVSQMLKKVHVTDSGDSLLIEGDNITKSEFKSINEELEAEGLKAAKSRPLLLGITKASLTTESFISAASFQETTKVLTQATLEGKRDNLIGLKENVIMGRLVPAGTGVSRYNDFRAEVVDRPGEENDGVLFNL